MWAILAAGAAVLGGIAGAISASQQSKAAEKAARANKAHVEEETALKMEDLKTQQKQFSGQQRTLIGRAGVQLNTGSPLALQAETERRMAEDRRRLQVAGEFEASQYEEQADLFKKMRPWQVGSSLLGGVAQGASFFI